MLLALLEKEKEGRRKETREGKERCNEDIRRSSSKKRAKTKKRNGKEHRNIVPSREKDLERSKGERKRKRQRERERELIRMQDPRSLPREEEAPRGVEPGGPRSAEMAQTRGIILL